MKEATSIAKDEVFTEVEGVFVAGDVSDGVYMQAVTAASGGVKAVLQMRDYLNGMTKWIKQRR